MTISTETRLVTYTGNGATTEFDFAFHIPTGALVVTLYTIAREMRWKFALKLCGRQMAWAAGFSLVIAWIGALAF